MVRLTINTQTITKNGKKITIAEMGEGILPFLRKRHIVCYIPHTGPEIVVNMPYGKITQSTLDGVKHAIETLSGEEEMR